MTELELLKLKERIINCDDEIEAFGLWKVYDRLLVDLWTNDKITLSELQALAMPCP